jgi:hypothetical protein
MLVHRSAWNWIVILVLPFVALPLFGQAQTSNLEDLRKQIEQRYTVLPIQNGIVLSPKNKNGTVSVELSGNTVAVNGAEVTGGELRTRLGADADLILQLSYLMPSARQALFSVDGNPNGSQITPRPDGRGTRPRRGRRKDDVIRFGGDVTVNHGETVDGDVVVFGGNGRVDGRVNGDVVVLGGSLTLGPEADIAGDAVTFGGTLSRDPGATIGGDVNEVSGPGVRLGEILRNRSFFWSGVLPVFTAASTLVRVGLLLLFGCIVMLVAEKLANRIGDRAAAEPVRAALTGLLAELLFVPALIMTVVLLIITILGIPLLLLIPFAVLALAVVFLVGFTGVAAKVGQLIGTRLGWTNMGPYLTTALGIMTLLLPTVLARLLGLSGLNFISLPLLVAGMLIEYLAWTVGFGAAALTYFKPPLISNSQSPAGPPPVPAQEANA